VILLGKRRAARELALKMLFQVDVGKLPVDEVVETTFQEVALDMETKRYAEQLVRGSLEKQSQIDTMLSEAATQWRLERFANVDRTVLRLAVYEIFFLPDTPTSVVINEGVELAKKYSTAESGKFVNGILGALVRKKEGNSKSSSS
jgi:N utilization substance protein B